ncbi:RNA polymerase III C11 subunit [Aspergillus tubingensis]
MPLTFCPNCSNALTISRAEPTTRHPLGVNRFECRTCPYQYALDQSWFEKTPMKQKEVEDVFGGKEEFANADSVATQCPAEDCNGDRAYFFQLQIRSADEPMTTFLKVGAHERLMRFSCIWPDMPC